MYARPGFSVLTTQYFSAARIRQVWAVPVVDAQVARKMSHGPLLRAFKELGIVGTWKELYKTRTLKFGQLVGEDKYGNKYYENKVDYPHMQHRWVVYAGNKNFYEIDASHIPAEWHGWIHSVTDEPPTETTTGSTHRIEPIKNAHGSSAPYGRNLGGVINAHYSNPSMTRPRGYGLGNGFGSAPNEEAYWTQPGWPMDKRNETRFQSTRKARVGFTLKDTPLTLQAKAATRAGLSLEEYKRFTEDDSPTKALLQLTGGSVGKAEAEQVLKDAQGALAALDPEEAELTAAMMLAGAEGVPEDPKKRELAVALAKGVPAPVLSTFAAEAHQLLTAEEAEALAAGVDPADLKAQALNFQRYIDDYGTIKGRAVADAVAEAVAKRDTLLKQIDLIASAEAKIAPLAESYDTRAFEAARSFEKAQADAVAQEAAMA